MIMYTITKSVFLLFIFSFISTVQLIAQCTSFTLPDDFGCVDQGETLTVTWTSMGCADGQDVYLSLIDVAANVAVTSWSPLPNSGSYTVTLPATLPPGDYRFYIQNYPWPADAWTYGINFEVKSVLPVTWESFRCYENSKGEVNLEWSTQIEINNKGFEIERSSDYMNWEHLGFEPASSEGLTGASYVFTDRTAQYGQNFYRLKQIDFEGGFDYSDIEYLSVGNVKSTNLLVFPNPTTDYITWNRDFKMGEPYFIMSANGQIMTRGKLSSNQLNLHFLPSGSYQLHITESHNFLVIPFIKN